MQTSRYHIFLLILTIAVFLWSAVEPADRPTWWMESAPVLLAVPLLILTYQRFRLTPLLYSLITIHAVILLVGAHYTYAHVPLFNWIRDMLGNERNSYDGVGHFAQGFVPAMIGRELLLRTSPLPWGKWMFAILVLSCLGISAIYELLEWAAAMTAGDGAQEFLSMQGDIWDTQKDMALAGCGAVAGLATLSRWHDRQLKSLT